MGDLILSLDLGTSAVKVGLFSSDGGLIRLALREQPLAFRQPGTVEQSLSKTWELVREGTDEVMTEGDPREVLAVVLTNQRGSVVPLDRTGTALIDMMVWMDHRGLAQVDRLRQVVGSDRYYEISGHPIVPITGVSKILWLQHESAETWQRTRCVGPPQTWFLHQLGCDESIVDFSSGSYLFPCDIRKKAWSTEIATLLSFPLDRLPRLVEATDIVGHLSRGAASDLGLLPGTPIVAGGGDGQCAAAGAGVVVPGSVMVNVGTATGVQVFLAEPSFDPAKTLNCAANVVPGAWEMEGHTQASGTVLRWFRDEFGSEEVALGGETERDAYDLLVERASVAPPGSDNLIFLPTFNGSTAPLVDPSARGALLGLRLSHTRGHVIRAVLEGISLEIRWMLDSIAATGVPVEEIRLAGGGSKNQQWNQIHADILGRPVRTVLNPDAALVGGAMCAAVGLGIFANFEQAAQAFVGLGPTIEPLLENGSVYARSYERYVQLFTLLSRERAFRP
jgi:xylulokinase